MPNPGLTPEQMREAVEAYRRVGTLSGAARSLGLDRGTFKNRLERAEEAGYTLSPGAKSAIEETGLAPNEAILGWRRVPDDEGGFNSVMWRKQPIEADLESMTEKVVAAFSEIPAAPAIIKSEKSPEGRFRFIPYADVHIGASASADRVGAAYNPKIARERLENGFAECAASLPAAEETVILNNGDLTHANDDRDVTPKSGHRLKVEGSHHDNIALSIALTVWQINHALQSSDVVRYRPNPGNHDPHTPSYLTLALKAHYRQEPRVIIEDSQRAAWVYQRGKVFLATHHGHGIKAKEFVSHIPGKYAREFGRSLFWYFFTAHFHNEKQESFGPVKWFQLPSVCSLDQHADDMGFSDTAAMRAMLFDDRAGLKNDITVRF